MQNKVHAISLTDIELDDLVSLISECKKQYHDVDNTRFLQDLPILIEKLPRSLRIKVAEFKNQSQEVVLKVQGFTFDDAEIGATPAHWGEVKQSTTHFDFYFCLLSSLVGRIFGFSNLQGGKLVQEIFPIKEDFNKQLGTGAVELFLHTEDTSLDYRAEYLGFACNRNIDEIPTNVSIPDFNALSDSCKQVLTGSQFKILNDRPCFSKEEREDNYSLSPILYGHESALCMKYDPLYMDKSELSAEQEKALEEFEGLVESSVVPVNLAQGEIAFIDNRRCAHGRSVFTPRFDGTDRWLKRTQISNCLSNFESEQLDELGRLFP